MLEPHMQAFNKLTPAQKRNVYIVLVLCFVFGLAVTVVYQSKLSPPQNTTGRYPALTRSPQQASIVELILSTPQLSLPKGQPFGVTITLDSGGVGVDAADFVLSFDPDVLEVTDIKEGSYFSIWPIKKTDGSTVKISGVASLENGKLVIPKGKALVATITFVPIGSGETTIAFDTTKTIVAAQGKNILNTTSLKELKLKIE